MAQTGGKLSGLGLVVDGRCFNAAVGAEWRTIFVVSGRWWLRGGRCIGDQVARVRKVVGGQT